MKLPKPLGFQNMAHVLVYTFQEDISTRPLNCFSVAPPPSQSLLFYRYCYLRFIYPSLYRPLQVSQYSPPIQIYNQHSPPIQVSQLVLTTNTSIQLVLTTNTSIQLVLTTNTQKLAVSCHRASSGAPKHTAQGRKMKEGMEGFGGASQRFRGQVGPIFELLKYYFFPLKIINRPGVAGAVL